MKKIIIFIVVILVLITGIYLDKKEKETSQYDEYTESYTHPVNNFSFKYPKDFTVTLIENDGVETLLVQSTTTKEAVQVLIAPFEGEDMDITADVIKDNIPDMKIDNAEEITITPLRKGLAFTSDNSAFDGKSSEIWFVLNGNLYQISTYFEYDDFLKGLFTTWKFN